MTDTLNKKDLVNLVSAKTGFSKRDTRTMITALKDVITDTLVADNKIILVGLGRFEVRSRAPRVGRDPNNGITVQIPAQKRPYFKPSPILSRKIDPKAK